MLPCVGQAAIGIEIRADDPETAAICAKLNDPITFACVTAERAFLKGMGGGCQVPVAAYAEARGQQLHIRAASFFAKPPRRGEVTGPITDVESLGRQLAAQLL
jgi:hydroxymethylbilane synthase